MKKFIFVTATYLLQQTALGGLFYLIAFNLIGHKNYGALIALFSLSEPVLMFLIGGRLANKIDEIRKNDLNLKKNVYLMLALGDCFFLLIFGFAFLFDEYVGLIAYAVWSLFSLSCRIYRQRFTRDVADLTQKPFQQLNAVANFATRGAPLLAPLALILFDQDVWVSYIFASAGLSAIASLAFFYSYNKYWNLSLLRPANPEVNESQKSVYSGLSGAWAKWHKLHLGCMNFAFGGIFFILANAFALSGSATVDRFFHSPIPLYAGFWIMMSLVAMGIAKKEWSFENYLRMVFLMGVVLAFGAYLNGPLKGGALLAFGLMFAFVVNRISTTVQSNFDANTFSEAETRAQTYGRLGSIAGISLLGYLIDQKLSFEGLEMIVGIAGMLSALILVFSYRKLVLNQV